MNEKLLIIQMTELVQRHFLTLLRETSPEKLDWQIHENGRSMIQIAREVAQSPVIVALILRQRGVEFYDAETGLEFLRDRQTMETLQDCENELEQNWNVLREEILALPDELLEHKICLRNRPGRPYSMLEVMAFHHWNTLYHLGQVAYIQTLYGDQEMHWPLA